MVKVRKDLTGRVFGKLIVLEQTDDYINPGSGQHVARWLCECSCERHKKIKVTGADLKSGHTQSCGCQRYESRLNDLTGMDFGYLHVVERANSHTTPNGTVKTMWKCTCTACNTDDIIIASEHLVNREYVSCGCTKSERFREANLKHGETRTRLYNIWLAMRRRCYNKNDVHYDNYGGRGIIVCDEWNTSYENFRDWAIKCGYDKTAKRGECTIERIDVNGNYCPENCKWATAKEQANNTRVNHIITVNGDSKTISQWADYLGYNYKDLYKIINRADNEENEILKLLKE